MIKASLRGALIVALALTPTLEVGSAMPALAASPSQQSHATPSADWSPSWSGLVSAMGGPTTTTTTTTTIAPTTTTSTTTTAPRRRPPPPIIEEPTDAPPFVEEMVVESDYRSAVLTCIAEHEGNPGYDNGAGSAKKYRGRYQFSQSSWNAVAAKYGREDLVGVDVAEASPSDQDDMAWRYFQASGYSPWPPSSGKCP